jgi:hypothetical protein
VAITIRDDGQQALTIFGGRKDADGLSHAHRLAHPPEFVNHPSVSVHEIVTLPNPANAGRCFGETPLQTFLDAKPLARRN